MTAAVGKFLAKAAKRLADQIGEKVGKVEKSDADQRAIREALARRVEMILANLDYTFWDDLPDVVEKFLMIVAQDGAIEALATVKAGGAELDQSVFDQANEHAIEWAKQRSAELVGMKRIDGDLVPNPNARWQIDTDTRESIRGTVEQAMKDGWSTDKIASALQDEHAFSDTRAEMIARTETARADVQGSLDGYRAAGVQRKRWLTAPDCCDDCQELDGEVVDIDDEFPGDGGDGPPLHPACRCDVLPVLEDE